MLAALADLLAVDIGSQMTKIVPGRVSTEASGQQMLTLQSTSKLYLHVYKLSSC
jgi:hypothetical protein